MTLIVGILCSDGAVVGSDGAATLGSPGQPPTVRQEVRKLDVLNEKIIVGVSGPVGLGQKIKHKIDEQWNNNHFRSLDEIQVSSKISEGMREHIVPLFQTAQVAVPAVGNLAASSFMSSSIVAMIVKHKPCLIQFDFQGASELASKDIPFVAVGSGQPLADPFLAFIRRIFWKDKLPTLNEGIFAALWTLRHAIEVNPGGVSNPIQLAVLKEDDGGCALELEESEYKEHEEAIKAAESKLSTFKEDMQSSIEGEEIPSV